MDRDMTYNSFITSERGFLGDAISVIDNSELEELIWTYFFTMRVERGKWYINLFHWTAYIVTLNKSSCLNGQIRLLLSKRRLRFFDDTAEWSYKYTLHCTVKSKSKYLFFKGEDARKPKWNTAKQALSDLKNILLIK